MVMTKNHRSSVTLFEEKSIGGYFDVKGKNIVLYLRFIPLSSGIC